MTDVWLTPRPILTALGGAESFDLDPCHEVDRPWPTARQHYTLVDNGLILPWFGRVFCNPPYGRVISKWLGRMAGHNRGVALIHARTDTGWFFSHVWDVATGLLFLRGRIDFLDERGELPQRAGGADAPSVLVSYGSRDLDVLAGCDLDGQFVPLRVPRGIVVAMPWQCLGNALKRGARWL